MKKIYIIFSIIFILVIGANIFANENYLDFDKKAEFSFYSFWVFFPVLLIFNLISLIKGKFLNILIQLIFLIILFVSIFLDIDKYKESEFFKSVPFLFSQSINILSIFVPIWSLNIISLIWNFIRNKK